jgi:hypothetical protein
MILQKVQIASILRWTVAIKETFFELGVLLGFLTILLSNLLHATNENFRI